MVKFLKSIYFIHSGTKIVQRDLHSVNNESWIKSMATLWFDHHGNIFMSDATADQSHFAWFVSIVDMLDSNDWVDLIGNLMKSK